MHVHSTSRNYPSNVEIRGTISKDIGFLSNHNANAYANKVWHYIDIGDLGVIMEDAMILRFCGIGKGPGPNGEDLYYAKMHYFNKNRYGLSASSMPVSDTFVRIDLKNRKIYRYKFKKGEATEYEVQFSNQEIMIKKLEEKIRSGEVHLVRSEFLKGDSNG